MDIKAYNRERAMRFYWNNRDKVLVRQRELYQQFKEERREKARKYREEHKELYRSSRLKHYYKNRDRYSQKHKQWLAENKTHVLEYSRKWKKMRFAIDISYRLKITLQTRTRLALKAKNATKCKKSAELVGITIEELRQYLESKFQPKMSWANYGKWHIDHIRPLASFDLTDTEQQKQAFHFTNLQPLWAIDNILKGAKY